MKKLASAFLCILFGVFFSELSTKADSQERPETTTSGFVAPFIHYKIPPNPFVFLLPIMTTSEFRDQRNFNTEIQWWLYP